MRWPLLGSDPCALLDEGCRPEEGVPKAVQSIRWCVHTDAPRDERLLPMGPNAGPRALLHPSQPPPPGLHACLPCWHPVMEEIGDRLMLEKVIEGEGRCHYDLPRRATRISEARRDPSHCVPITRCPWSASET